MTGPSKTGYIIARGSDRVGACEGERNSERRDRHAAQSRSRVMVVTGRSQSQVKVGHLCDEAE